MKRIILGKSGNRNVCIDLDVLLRTRLLIQANSGGGKSWLLRRLAEQFCGHVPVIILDPEGEFPSLREKFNFVLVGKGGETPTDCRSAAMLAHKLLELRTSAVIDLYELKPSERHHYVKLFLDATINAPKNLWRPTIYIGDEWHNFCPEKGAGESEASESSIAMATRGRKRGFCFIPATQRLGKLRKDFAAELLNVLIGPTFIDIDRKRAAECLGIPNADYRDFSTKMQVLEPGLFFGFGRAISKERVLFKVGDVQTTHPEAGAALRDYEPPPPPEKIKGLLPKLADLPKQAEEKEKTERELRGEIRALKIDLVAAKKQQPKPVAAPARNIIDPAQATEIKQLRRLLEQAMKFVMHISTHDFDTSVPEAQVKAAIDAAVARGLKIIEGKLESRNAQVGTLKKQASALIELMKSSKKDATVDVKVEVAHRKPFAVSPPPFPPPAPDNTENNGEFELRGGALKILKAAAQYPEGVTDSQISILTEYRATSRGEYKKSLLRYGYVVRSGDKIVATQKGIAALGTDFERLPTGDALREHWLKTLTGGDLALLKIYLAAYPAEVTNQQIIDTGLYKATSVGEYRKHLVGRRLVDATKPGAARASDQLYDIPEMASQS